MSSFAQNATIVLVHGAWAALAEDRAALQRILEITSGPAVLAGHTYGKQSPFGFWQRKWIA